MNKSKLEKLQKLFNGVADIVPKGWYTARQLCAMTGKGHSTVSNMIRVQTDAKKVKVKMFFIKQKNSTRPTPHYFFKI